MNVAVRLSGTKTGNCTCSRIYDGACFINGVFFAIPATATVVADGYEYTGSSGDLLAHCQAGTFNAAKDYSIFYGSDEKLVSINLSVRIIANLGASFENYYGSAMPGLPAGGQLFFSQCGTIGQYKFRSRTRKTFWVSTVKVPQILIFSLIEHKLIT